MKKASVYADNLKGHIPWSNPYDNKLSGSIPTSFRGLTTLEEVHASTNVFSGTIPDLSNLTKLRELYLYKNKLSGPILASFKFLTALAELGVGTNELSGTIPDLGNLTRLRGLSLHENKLTGSIPASFGALTALDLLMLGGNALSGTVPASLSNMRSLKEVCMWGNPHLGGCLPASWRQQLSGFDWKK